MKEMQRLSAVFAAAAVSLCGAVVPAYAEGSAKSDDIVILYTNDVHCGIDDHIGYDGLALYKREMETLYDTVILVDAGDKKVAFVGASTPETLSASTPTYFQNENGEYIYSFGEDGSVYTLIQNAVDDARAEGADYVIVLGHLGESDVTKGLSAPEIAGELSGIDVIIDGHSHETTPGLTVRSKDGRDVIVTQTGTKLNHIGRLTISADGSMKIELIGEVPAPDESMGIAEDS